MKYLFVFAMLLTAISCSSLHKANTSVQKQAAGSFLYQADPTIFYDKGVYYLYGTNGSNADSGFRVFISKDLKNLRTSGN